MVSDSTFLFSCEIETFPQQIMVIDGCFHQIEESAIDSESVHLWDFESPIWDSDSEDSTFESNDDDLPIWDTEFEESYDEEVLAVYQSDLIEEGRVEDLDSSESNFSPISCPSSTSLLLKVANKNYPTKNSVLVSKDGGELTKRRQSQLLQMFDHMLQRKVFNFPRLEETFDGNSKRIRDPGIEETFGKSALFDVRICASFVSNNHLVKLLSMVFSNASVLSEWPPPITVYCHYALPLRKDISDDKPSSRYVPYHDTGWTYVILAKEFGQGFQELQYGSNAYESSTLVFKRVTPLHYWHGGRGELGAISSEHIYRLCIFAYSLCEMQESKLSLCTVSGNGVAHDITKSWVIIEVSTAMFSALLTFRAVRNYAGYVSPSIFPDHVTYASTLCLCLQRVILEKIKKATEVYGLKWEYFMSLHNVQVYIIVEDESNFVVIFVKDKYNLRSQSSLIRMYDVLPRVSVKGMLSCSGFCTAHASMLSCTSSLFFGVLKFWLVGSSLHLELVQLVLKKVHFGFHVPWSLFGRMQLSLPLLLHNSCAIWF